MRSTPRHYYNEIDDFAAAWLESLIAAGEIPEGDVDRRDIRDIEPADLCGYTQCHFFAGIGGWPLALKLAGWPVDRPVWTGSCPCQPFSAAGRRGGFADERHLWPAWFWLIVQCRPDVLFGEQVDKALAWLDLVCTDLEGEGYAVGPAILPAAGVGAPHGRHRLWFVADAQYTKRRPIGVHDERNRQDARWAQTYSESGARSKVCELGDGHVQRGGRYVQLPQDATAGFWADADWIPCRDGKYRPVEPGTFPLAHGVPARVGRLRGYGNAIVPEVAAAFIQAYLDVEAMYLTA